jgi:hypothetical protein
MYDTGYDGYYEAEGYAGMAESEAMQEQEYQDYLGGLLEKGETALFAVHIALDWLNSKEFNESGLTPIEYLNKLRGKFQGNIGKEF